MGHFASLSFRTHRRRTGQKRPRDIDTFLSANVIVPLRGSTGTRTYKLLKLYAKSHGLHVFDALVAATSMEEGLTLVTKNRKHFGIIEGLSLEVPLL